MQSYCKTIVKVKAEFIARLSSYKTESRNVVGSIHFDLLLWTNKEQILLRISSIWSD